MYYIVPWLAFQFQAILTVTSAPQLTPETKAQCWGPGIWPHPSHCRLFSLCLLNTDGHVQGQLFLCPLGTSYSSSSRSCTSGNSEVPNCATSLEEDTYLKGLDALAVSTNTTIDHTCDTTDSPYCADENTLVVCGPNEAFIGVALCSMQKEQNLGCNTTMNTCSQENDIVTINLENQEAKLNSSSDLETLLPNINAEIPFIYDDFDNYDNNELPTFSDIKCTKTGIQCADESTLVDCDENSTEPVFMMSCSSFIHSDDEDASGYCDMNLDSCVIFSQGSEMSLEVKLSSNYTDICNGHEGLTCVNDEILVACAGDEANNYAISCNGSPTLDSESILHGYCSVDSCVVNSSKININEFPNPPATEPSKEKPICKTVGMQCIDSSTLAACLPNFKVSYTVPCEKMLPNVADKEHVVYCDERHNTCALKLL
ncbi:hypothetical protein C0J52_18831 [Blattella germanica]|nr:hypothetical protein C0J52_18831 [Blattella germanica]